MSAVLQDEAHLKNIMDQQEDDVSPTHQTGGNSHSSTTASLPVPQTTHGKSGTWTGASQEDKLARSLEDCLSVFQSGLLQDIHAKDLVFCDPSDQDDPQLPPPLQSLAISNTQFMEYQDWILTMFTDTLNLDCGQFEHCRSIRDQLLNDIRNEWIRLHNLEQCSWQMASHNSRPMFSQSDPGPTASDLGPTQVIDTCVSRDNGSWWDLT